MSWLRDLFSDPNEKIPCMECGTLILRRTARETGGFCAPCAKLGPDLRAQRRDFAAAVADGSAFRLTPREAASAAPLTDRMPPHTSWHIDPEDTDQTRGRTQPQVLQTFKAGGKPALYLRASDDISLSIDTCGPYAAVLYGDSAKGVLRMAHGPMAATAQIAAPDQVFVTDPSDGSALTAVHSKFHLPRDAALAVLGHVLAGTAPAHFHWIDTEFPMFLAAGHG